MNKVIILGANGSIAKQVISILNKKGNFRLTLYLRDCNSLDKKDSSGQEIIEGDILDYPKLKSAIHGKDIVYANLAGELEAMAKNIVNAMLESGVKRVIFISSIGIYDVPLRPVLQPYRKATDIFESSGLEYTILRPTWFTNDDEIDFETTKKGELEKGSVVSRKSIATFISKIIESPGKYIHENLGINKPNS